MSATEDNNAPPKGPQCRVLIQQCVQAELHIDDANLVKIDRGIVVFVSFFAGATEDVVRRAAQSILKIKLSENHDGKLISVLDLPGSVLLIPQACLGGKRKNNAVQYHQLIEKNKGEVLFKIMESELQKHLSSCPKVTAVAGRIWPGNRIFVIIIV
ncbi:putative D-tyrosyl-tRNA(Tyr) deacylase 2 isoform X2 [Varroa destructor]|uniref:D-aminoacyl-tRNA deacylase n=1 Tax=Varroa destructor TaxID=109461 RepID=A0A7M7MA75_VARDE|nr:putative D-tyrosyl-tRNA(Tyr) deacylase 2 isoform X2 [Varroa destructor]